MEYMSCPEAAEKWGISERRVQILCSQNRIPGVSKLGYMQEQLICFPMTSPCLTALRSQL